MHPLINPSENYEPSRDLKKRWLFTKKSPLKFGSLVLPGLYQSSGFKTQRLLVSCVFVIELYGLYVLYSVLPQPLLALLFTVLDFVFAIVSHLLKNKLCTSKNILILAKNGIAFRTDGKGYEYEKRQQKIRIFWYKFYEWFFYSIIILLAIFKMKQTLHYGSYIALGQLIFICVLYGIAALIHITATGNFFAELWFRYGFFGLGGSLIRERRDIEDAKGSPTITIHTVDRHTNFDLEEKYNVVDNNKQYIKDLPGDTSSVFKMWGILQDGELNSLASVQGSLQQKLALFLLQVQLKNMESDIADRNVTNALIKLQEYHKK